MTRIVIKRNVNNETKKILKFLRSMDIGLSDITIIFYGGMGLGEALLRCKYNNDSYLIEIPYYSISDIITVLNNANKPIRYECNTQVENIRKYGIYHID